MFFHDPAEWRNHLRNSTIFLKSCGMAVVLHWVQKEDESEIQDAFRRTLAVRKLTPEAQELADRFFFETLVRVHRTGEGAPFTGLKPAGSGITPAIAASDEALVTGDISPLVKALNAQVNEGVHARFNNAVQKKKFKAGDGAAGREYVQAYVEYVHYAEGIHTAAEGSAELHPKTEQSHGTDPRLEPGSQAKTTHTH